MTIHFHQNHYFPMQVAAYVPYPARPIQPAIHEIPKLKFDIPTTEYISEKFAIVPINKQATNNGRFETINEAMTYIADHCKKYHGSFTRSLAKTYSQFVQVLTLTEGGYMQLSEIEKKVFNHWFNKVSKNKD